MYCNKHKFEFDFTDFDFNLSSDSPTRKLNELSDYYETEKGQNNLKRAMRNIVDWGTNTEHNRVKEIFNFVIALFD